MTAHLDRWSRGAHSRKEQREKFLRSEQARLGTERTRGSPWAAGALGVAFGLLALWATGMLPEALIQFLPGLG